jgi:hypothetical protein
MSGQAEKTIAIEKASLARKFDSPWLGWGTLLATCGILFLTTFFLLAGPSWELALFRLLMDGGLALAWAISMTGIGWIGWKLIAPARSWEMHPVQIGVTCAALGMGGVSLLMLGLGLLGWLNFELAAGVVGSGFCVAVWVAWRKWRDVDLKTMLSEPARWNWIWAPVSVLAAVVAIGATFPPGLLWGDEPNGYDVAEYHLQVPREWYEAGHITPLQHNVFSYFPFNVEMHYLLAMELHKGPWAAMYLAQMMHAAMCALAVLAVYGIAGGGKQGAIAAALMAATPWTGLLSAVAYDDGGTLLWGTLAIGWGLKTGCLRGAVIAACMAGFAAGSKLSVAPLVFLALPAAMFVSKWAAGSLRHAIRRVAIYGLVSIAVLSPWLIRNYAWAGNPVFPEAFSFLGHAHFSPVQVQRWQKAYEPDAKHRGIAGHFEALYQQVIRDWRYGYLFLPMGIAAFVLTRESNISRQLLWLFLFQLAFWLIFTHLQGRFMVMTIPIFALMIAQVSFRQWWTGCAVVAVLLAGFSTIALIQKLSPYLTLDRQLAADGPGLIGRENLDGMRMLDTRRLRDNAQLDLVGDACAFLYQIPISRLHYKTVFDVDTSDPKKTITQSWLTGMPGSALVWPDIEELKRFSRTYFDIPAPTEEEMRFSHR